MKPNRNMWQPKSELSDILIIESFDNNNNKVTCFSNKTSQYHSIIYIKCCQSILYQASWGYARDEPNRNMWQPKSEERKSK
jgi:hypothetical protein